MPKHQGSPAMPATPSCPATAISLSAATAPAAVQPLPLSTRVGARPRFGVRVVAMGSDWAEPSPLGVFLGPGRARARWRAYDEVVAAPNGFAGRATVAISPRTSLFVTDTWRSGDRDVTVEREVTVRGGEEGGFMSALLLARRFAAGWGEVTPFAPGAVYGDSEPVPPLSAASPQSRRGGAGYVLVREDRLAAPMFAVGYPDGIWMGVFHCPGGAQTTVADGDRNAGGDDLVDQRFGFASLGGIDRSRRVHLGAFFPGTEGPVTYGASGVPLHQYKRWRRRFHPLVGGLEHRYRLVFTWGTAATPARLFTDAWRWAWEALSPEVVPVDDGEVVRVSTSVLAGQVKTNGKLTGVPIEVSAVTGATAPRAPAIMGFVGANTDAAYVLLRMGASVGGHEGAKYASLGERIMDSFTLLDFDPPTGEGFDLVSGRLRTYRKIKGRPAVYMRSIADGCAGALKAWAFEAENGNERAPWLAWAQAGADWLVSAQGLDGSLPRAWEAGSGRVLDSSKTASHISVAFLARVASATGKTSYLDAAARAAEFSWSVGGSRACFAGATLDNPDVVDKEAAIFALEGFLELYRATGEPLWLERALVAASIAETWIYSWDVSMPVDADQSDLHWKPGVPTVGQQLIATGVSTCDGFLAVNAASFACLYRLTGDEHFLEVARVVTHGTKAMLALPGRTFDLQGPGWQQEHWCFAVPRGRGLTRDWLPWVAVANIEGVLRIYDLGEPLAKLVLGRVGEA